MINKFIFCVQENNNEKYRLTYLDSLKGAAILGVIAVHSGLGHQEGVLSAIGQFGANSVQLFFVISAYLACKSLNKKTINSFEDWLKWLKRKVVHIAPLYYLALIAALIETGGNGNSYWAGGKPISVLNIVSHVLFLNGFSPYWINSIMSIEWYIADLMIFYAIVPLILMRVNSRKRAGILVAGSIFFALVFNHGVDVIFNISSNEILRTYVYNFGFITQFQVMAFGILLFYVFEKIENKIDKLEGYLILFAGIYLLIGIMFNRALEVTSIYGFLGMGFCLLVLGTNISRCKLLDNKVLSIIGRYSYGIYLFHYMIIDYCYSKGWIKNGCGLKEYIFKYICIVILSFFVAVICQNIGKILEYSMKKEKNVYKNR